MKGEVNVRIVKGRERECEGKECEECVRTGMGEECVKGEVNVRSVKVRNVRGECERERECEMSVKWSV